MKFGQGFVWLTSLFVVATADRYDIPYPDGSIIKKEGDILTWNRTTTPGMMSSALRDGNYKWPNAKVPVHFHSSISASERNIIINAMKEIHEKTCVRFIEANDDHTDFVLIVKPWQSVCNSFVGRIGGKQILNLGPTCYGQGVILHELMHALGFIHEHNRADRDDYVSINWNMIENGEKGNFEKRESKDLALMDTGYAYDSVMHYPGNLFSKDKSTPTIVPKKIVAKLGGTDQLSPIDALRINRYYQCGTTTTTDVPKKEVKWIRHDYNMYWSYGCDFWSHDIEILRTSNLDCLFKCFYNPKCTHVTFHQEQGICYLKAISTAEAPRCSDKENLCAVKGSAEWNKPEYNSKCRVGGATKNQIQWEWTNFEMHWDYGCDFYGHDIEIVASSSGDCLDKCFYNPRCTHFTWTPSGLCYLKSIDPSDVKLSCLRKEFVCGVKGAGEANKPVYSKCTATSSAPTAAISLKSYDYDMHWSYGCDFPGRDIAGFVGTAAECVDKCFYNPKCTHITWTPNGYCNLKSITTADAVPKCGPKAYVCGVKETGKLQSVMCP